MLWPHDYHTWTGNLSELVDTANTILRDQDPAAPLVTVRTARHYQGEGALGRGTKQGRAAAFNFHDLAQLVSAKSLVNEGLPISYTSSLLANTSAGDLALALSPSGQKATAVVAQMMAQSPPASHPVATLGSLFTTPLAAASRSPTVSPGVPGGLGSLAVPQHLPAASTNRPVSWLRLDIDETALARASAQERTTAAHTLLHWAARLTAPTQSGDPS